jgi:hypothetical protein
VWTASQWAEFKEEYTSLLTAQSGKLGLNTCSSVKSLGVPKGERIRISEEWSNNLIKELEKIVQQSYQTFESKIKDALNRKGTRQQ